MKNFLKQTMGLALLTWTLTSCDKNGEHQPTFENRDVEVTVASGDSSAIISKVNQFRNHAGLTLNTFPDGSVNGRREINWDGVPADFISPRLFPANFFNNIDPAAPDGRKRGLVYTPNEATLLISDNSFSEIDTAFKRQFAQFSKNKLFSPKGTTTSEIRFMVPGTNTPAYVTSFGLIFSDVDNSDATVVAIYDGIKLIGIAKAQAADKKFSFVGLHTHKSRITRIKIISGNSVLAAGVRDGASNDMVVIDDLIYNEPVAIK
ncbi:hypothetical protein J7E50_03240 [Pedobacter sp. ISL-68]|uniref:hypothetical protein n=1 Tax=unclassified Pedobacter TaxID=2628915 RepID=UPI001BEB1BC8|nr:MULTISPECIES: hypothetical protein [unclassified Pedobacter]MBT2560236.1 hypothetical protein [Pedobacter sp. ISL-64]MBT2589216.1 hypothetical protein [Pedobacter sp. ISL-68]